MSRVDTLIEMLDLRPHPEGGHYVEIFRSDRTVQRGEDARSAVTVIHYLLRRGEVSRWHVVTSDEIWHFHEGDPLELLLYTPGDAAAQRVIIGPDLPESTPVHVVPAGVWQATRPLGAYGLAGCTVAPGFEFADFRFVADVPGHEPAFAGPLAAHADLL